MSSSSSSSPDEGLEGSTLRVDAQRHSFALLVLRNEAMDELWRRDRKGDRPSGFGNTHAHSLVSAGSDAGVCTFSLPHRQQTVLVAVAERPLGDRLEVAGVNSPAGNRVAALTHAGVVAQAPFVQVRVGEGVAAGDPFSLGGKKHRES